MRLFISVINHNHDKLIYSNPTLSELSKEHQVVLKSNTPASRQLQDYCKQHQITLLQGTKKKGFGANNNEVFYYCEQALGMSEGDYFLVLNPDVEITCQAIQDLMAQVKINEYDISTINLFKNREMTIYDNSIRIFPSLLNPIKSLFGIKRTDFYDKDIIETPTSIDWSAGSFLMFNYQTYKSLHGFDDKYFMYFEDVDICKRAKEKQVKVTYIPNIRAIHFAQHNNRKRISKHTFYYLKSTFRYFLYKNFIPS